MTENQEKFIQLLYKNGEMTAEECCKRMKIEISNDYNTYYSELCSLLPYPSEEDEFNDKVQLKMFEDDPFNEHAVFGLTSEGKKYIEDNKKSKKDNKRNKWQLILAVLAVILALISLMLDIV